MPNIEFFIFVFIIIGIIIHIPISHVADRFKIKVLGTGYKRFAATIILSPLVYSCLATMLLLCVSHYPERSFNKKDWLASPDKRYEMSEDLIDSKVLIGKSRKEVINMLGPAYFVDNMMVYSIGTLPGMSGIDPDDIVINFRNGKATDVVQEDRN